MQTIGEPWEADFSSNVNLRWKVFEEVDRQDILVHEEDAQDIDAPSTVSSPTHLGAKHLDD
jgi:hypothetical protein